MRRFFFLSASLAGLLLWATASLAQSYSIDWFTIDGGGGSSSNGQYAVSGTIGQPDAGGTMTGGSYSLIGGFWAALAAVQTPGAPWLTIARTTTNTVVISWPSPADGWMLEQAPTLAPAPPPWSQLSPPYQTNTTQCWLTVPAPSGNKFYRLHKSASP